MQLSQIFIYPIKSLGGISLNEVVVEPRGLQHDRRWMLVDESGTFYTQRTFAEMALLQVNLAPDGLMVTHKTKKISSLFIPFSATNGNKFQVSIWDDVCLAAEVSKEANTWFSEALGKPCRLVQMPESTKRAVDPEYGQEKDVVSFADAYPILLIGQESLNDLNARLPQAIPMNRFRPNLVYTGGAPFAEDTWQTFTIGDFPFRGVKLCSRCVLTTIDQATGQKGAEPLKTLATYRVINNKVRFGQNVIPSFTIGNLHVGDTLHVESFQS